MIRDLAGLTAREHDLAIVGGGVFGTAIARDAALRGLSVALIDAADFAGASSANSLKMVHGGIRYVQHLDVVRIQESVRERRALLRMAPHLVHPLPIVIPTYGRGLKSRVVLRAGVALYDLLAANRNRGLTDPARRIPSGRALGREECLTRFPGLPADGLTGGVLFHDAQMYNPSRLALGFLRAAVDRTGGVAAANYVRATGFLQRGGRIAGVAARDELTGAAFEIRARLVVNAAGGWSEFLLEETLGLRLRPPSTFSRDAAFVVRRPLVGECGLAVQGRTHDPDALLNRGARHLFLAPWRGHTLVGVWHRVERGRPERVQVTEAELATYLDEVNASYPALSLTREDVTLWNAGLVLFGRNRPGAEDLSYGKRSRIVDHERSDGLPGLMTVIGVRYTTARGIADRVVTFACRRLGRHRRGGGSATTVRPSWGGEIEDYERFMASAGHPALDGVPLPARAQLLRNHGSCYADVLRHAPASPAPPVLPGSQVLSAEVLHAVRDEAAVRLSDVVLRRTELGSADHPGHDALRETAHLMAVELGWSPERQRAELRDLDDYYEARGARPAPRAGTPAHRRA